MENQLVLVNPKQYGLEEKKALELTSGLTTILTERESLKNEYLNVIEMDVTEDNLKTFKELRLKIVKNRTQGIEKWHKANKEFFLTGGRFVDAAKAPDKDKLIAAIKDMPSFAVINLKTKEAQDKADLIRDKYNAFKVWANEQINTL